MVPPAPAMQTVATAWPLEDIWQALVPLLPDISVEWVPTIDSTNETLLRRVQAGPPQPTLLVAEQQTAGHGRMGRPWISQVRHGRPNLTFSLAMPLAPKDWSGLSLAIGLSLAQSLHPDIRLKWPNDLWLHGRKLAGILIETVNPGRMKGQRWVVLGVGLNIEAPDAAGLSTAPAGLAELWPHATAPWALRRMTLPLVQSILAFEAQGFAPLQAAFNRLDALAQTHVSLSDGRQGIALGVDTSGALLLQTAQGLQKVISAEVSLRPLSGPAAAAV
ncbi:biotin--[acetyl-CoA-carboxylase] ligase [Rhodoferax sp.]|uniref:biotin--[acetyl-CoA-carboxylase] ligase n=1 Tax=Rhodoferax sp. TaxID=50421 RepID=UPI0025E8BAD8|nr:biotin--[acetyl-CoA-carboxylase] ligase [Rhodoferax sp.]